MVCGVRLIIHARILQVHVFVCMFCNLLGQSDTTIQLQMYGWCNLLKCLYVQLFAKRLT